MVIPAPELLDRWGVTTIEEFIDEARKRKYEGFALDAKHLVRQASRFNGFKTDFAPMEAIVPQLLANDTKIISVHPLPDADQKTKLEEMVDANELKLLNMAQDAKWKGLVVCHYPIGKFFGAAVDQRPIIKEIQHKIG